MGDFGARTESAVKTFQTVKGLRVGGIAGKATFEELCG
jgi:peptidoglycan hydrolase-like protein with peptidoglycan-binding domain